MIHLGELAGQPGYAGVDSLVEVALADLSALEEGGMHGVLVENWKDSSHAPFVDPKVADAMASIVKAVVMAASVPVGVNVLPNDYRAALDIAVKTGASFVQLDVFSDEVRTQYVDSSVSPFEIHVDRNLVGAWRRRLGADGVALVTTVHPSHHTLLNREWSLEDSTRAAIDGGADAVVVTGTIRGEAPTVARVEAVRRAAGDVPVIVGSGLDGQNAPTLLGACDGAIVGASIKSRDLSRVEPNLVRALAGIVSRLR
jgi:uncharacterized protein